MFINSLHLFLVVLVASVSSQNQSVRVPEPNWTVFDSPSYPSTLWYLYFRSSMGISIIVVSLYSIWLSFCSRSGWSIIIVLNRGLCPNGSPNYKYFLIRFFWLLELFVISIRFCLRIQSWVLKSKHELMIVYCLLFNV